MKKYFLVFLILILFTPPVFAINLNEAIKAAEDIEKIIFAANSNMRSYISYVDTHYKDGHLIINVKKPMMMADNSIRNDIFNAILDLWKKTKYVREKGYAGWVEGKFFDTQTLERGKLGPYK